MGSAPVQPNDGGRDHGRPNRFITFEGGEGAGKSTQIRRLADALRAVGQPVVVTREPGGSTGAEEIRKLLVEGLPGRWTPETEVLLHFAARADHLDKLIRPALAEGSWVLCDRFADSTIAYQGYGHGLDLAWLDSLRRQIVGTTEPGLTIIFDLPIEIGLARAAARLPVGTSPEDRYERMDKAFHQRLRDGFMAIAKAGPQRCQILRADRSIDDVADSVREIVSRHFGMTLPVPTSVASGQG
ncbi:dTMP kinase [Dongia soli]|uniref:Thymidylate kinase n=1 Tax=Dongia soli TaxID=600628 RepID=A0ABU5EAT7_9PROT|nr:dTMP kinase [Dongia soli]MDY0883110.1 dTMP kinase [Dongia soli]